MKKKVLIIDDNKDFLEQITETMELSGYESHGFTRSRPALKQMERIKPDIILLDLRLEGENGCDVAHELRQNERTRDIPIVAITAFFDEKVEDYLKNICHVEACLKKPLKPLDVIRQVEKVSQGD